MNNKLKHIGIKGMRWGVRKKSTNESSRGSDKIKVSNIKSVSKQKMSSLRKNLKTAAIVGGILGGTLGTIAMAKMMKTRSQKKAISDAISLTKKWETNRAAKNVIHLPARMPKPVQKFDWSKMDKTASVLKRGQGGHYEIPKRSFEEMERVAEILRRGGLP